MVIGVTCNNDLPALVLHGEWRRANATEGLVRRGFAGLATNESFLWGGWARVGQV